MSKWVELFLKSVSWRNGYAGDCKAPHGGSIPSDTSIERQKALLEIEAKLNTLRSVYHILKTFNHLEEHKKDIVSIATGISVANLEKDHTAIRQLALDFYELTTKL